MYGLIIHSEVCNEILTGRRKCILRGTRTHVRGTIGLIRKGAGKVAGLCELVDCIGPLPRRETRRHAEQHHISVKELRDGNSHYKHTYIWVFKNVRTLTKPINYGHKAGVSTWHPLPDSVANKSPIVLRGRSFPPRDLKIISRLVLNHYAKGRTYISQAICKTLGWRQPNGWLKDRACRDVLIQLESMGVIALPPMHVNRGLTPRKKVSCILSGHDLTSPVTDFPKEITLEFAKGNEAELIWNELVRRYHYLGHTVLVGRCIKYLVKAEGRLLGAVGFSSPAWRLTPRDALLPLIGISLSDVRDLVINNSRFLILPNVKVSNLASSVLSLAAERVLADWSDYYSIVPQVVETFVQPSKYLGTCYKAANWIEIGMTKGYAKKGASNYNSQEPKQVFLYGLNTKTRRKLLKITLNVKEASKLKPNP